MNHLSGSRLRFKRNLYGREKEKGELSVVVDRCYSGHVAKREPISEDCKRTITLIKSDSVNNRTKLFCGFQQLSTVGIAVVMVIAVQFKLVFDVKF